MAKIRIYFTTDIHGSEVCFKKFLNAGAFYKADALILGGDITGKAVVPIIEEANGVFRCKFLGERLEVKKGKELEELIQRIRSTGFYPYLTTPSEAEELSRNKEKLNSIFVDLTIETLERWLELAESRLKTANIKCFISPGNDDIKIVDDILEKAAFIINPNEKIVNLDDNIEMISLGYSNPTPWNCPRDITEEELKDKIEKMAIAIKKPETAIFNIHVPPYGIGIDLAPELDEELRPKLEPGGKVKMIPVGSKAVYNAIVKYQPLLGLHGHIHESKGFGRIGRTICFNPGSEYQEGILRGVLIEISDGRIKDFMFVAG